MNTKIHTCYRSNEDVMWVMNQNAIVVIQKQDEKVYEFVGLEASLWEWLNQAYEIQDVLLLASNVYRLPMKELREQIHDILQNWVKLHLLEVTDG